MKRTKIELANDNPESRCPCMTVVDTSGSMQGAPIAELNRGLIEFKEALLQDPLACLKVELCVLAFNAATTVEVDWVSPTQFAPPTLAAGGDTNLGAALLTACDMVRDRLQAHKAAGIPCLRPWLVLLTDAYAQDDLTLASKQIREAEARKKLSFFPIGVSTADTTALSSIGTRPALKLQGLRFAEFFEWLSLNLSSMAGSFAGQQVPLTSTDSWATAQA